jgi:hypothetical protein
MEQLPAPSQSGKRCFTQDKAKIDAPALHRLKSGVTAREEVEFNGVP